MREALANCNTARSWSGRSHGRRRASGSARLIPTAKFNVDASDVAGSAVKVGDVSSDITV